MLTLYDYFRSSASYRVRIALALKNLPVNIIPIHLMNNGGEQHSKTYQKINPQRLVPSLQIDQHILTQSLAIIEFLEETYPDIPLLPIESFAKAKVRALALSIVADIHPLNNLRVLNYLTNQFSLSENQKMEWYHHWVQLGLQAIETQLQHSSNGQFCLGTSATIADCCLIPQIYNAKRFNIDLAPFPTIVSIDTYCEKLSAFKAAKPQETSSNHKVTNK